MQTTTYKRIPDLPGQMAGERPFDFGLRAFRFLLVEEVSAALLDTPVLEQALNSSLAVITAPDLTDATRERYHRLRHEITGTVVRRHAAARLAEQTAAAAPVAPTPSGGSRVRRVPVVPQLPPSGAMRAF